MKIIEQYLISKSGNIHDCEDMIYIGPQIVAVIDGATSKTFKFINNITSGQFAASTIYESLKSVDPKWDSYTTLSYINNQLKDSTSLYISDELNEKPSASIVIYNDYHKEIWSYGDCQYRINNKTYSKKSVHDIKLSKKRSLIICSALEKGMSIEEISKDDIGRKAIIEDLLLVQKYANLDYPVGYPVLNGTYINKSLISVHPVNKSKTLILASDGYPKLYNTLDKTELYLHQQIELDKLCIDRLIGTKGIQFGNISYDDRAFIKIIF